MQMENQCTENVPSGANFDEQLQQLAIEAKQHPPLSPQRQLVLNRLVNKILQSDSLSHPQRESWSPNLYEDLYNEALQKTLFDICRRIDSYNPEHPVMAWVNYLLGKRFQDAVKEWYSNNGKNVVISIDKLDSLVSNNLVSVEQMPSESQMLRQFLEDDPENILKNEHIRGHPEASFQYIAIARFVDDKTWEAISAELDNMSIQTLCNFFNKQLRKLMPYFQQYLR